MSGPGDIMTDRLRISGLCKRFTLHLRDGLELPVFENLSLGLRAGECVVLAGPSGAGKSTLLRCIYGNYLADAGSIEVRHHGAMVELVGASHRTILDLRRRTIGHVSQFLRVVPRLASIEVVAEPLIQLGLDRELAQRRAGEMLTRLHLPERLWHLPPATFSGGEQQRINLARTLVVDYPVLLLDEPTASLDPDNRLRVVRLIAEARGRGAAILATLHDPETRHAVATRTFDMVTLSEAA